MVPNFIGTLIVFAVFSQVKAKDTAYLLLVVHFNLAAKWSEKDFI